jgi:hypothetical protein
MGEQAIEAAVRQKNRAEHHSQCESNDAQRDAEHNPCA